MNALKNTITKTKKKKYSKKDHITVQSFNQCSFLKIYQEIGTGNDVYIYETSRRYNGLKDYKSKTFVNTHIYIYIYAHTFIPSHQMIYLTTRNPENQIFLKLAWLEKYTDFSACTGSKIMGASQYYIDNVFGISRTLCVQFEYCYTPLILGPVQTLNYIIFIFHHYISAKSHKCWIYKSVIFDALGEWLDSYDHWKDRKNKI